MTFRKTSESYVMEITPEGIKSNHKCYPQENLRKIVRDLIRTFYLIRLELKQQVYGLSLGHLWLLLEPAFQAGTYYFLLTVVFSMQGSDATFSFFLVAIIYWRSHAMLVSSAPLFLTTKGYQYIDQGFGLNIAFMEFVAQELVLFSIRFFVMLLFLMLSGYEPHITWLAAFFVGVCMFCFTFALVIWLAILGTLIKDTSKIIGHIVWLWWYLSPGLYQFNQIPDWAQPFFALNPFTYILPAVHDSLLNYTFHSEHLINNLVLASVSLIFIFFGWREMKRLGYMLAQYV